MAFKGQCLFRPTSSLGETLENTEKSSPSLLGIFSFLLSHDFHVKTFQSELPVHLQFLELKSWQILSLPLH